MDLVLLKHRKTKTKPKNKGRGNEYIYVFFFFVLWQKLSHSFVGGGEYPWICKWRENFQSVLSCLTPIPSIRALLWDVLF